MSRGIVLLYDGGCAFCVRSLRVLKRFDRDGKLELVDATDRASTIARFPQAAGADFDSAMYAVDGLRVYEGFDAFRRAIRETPALRWIAPLLFVPGVPQFGRFVYALVARNRHALGCGSSVCEP
jgi:predicted DCC family thiol-disulfide oxidoreductase YuxK